MQSPPTPPVRVGACPHLVLGAYDRLLGLALHGAEYLLVRPAPAHRGNYTLRLAKAVQIHHFTPTSESAT